MRPCYKNSKKDKLHNSITIFISLSIILSFINPVIVASAASAQTVAISSVSDKLSTGESAQVHLSITNSVNVTGMNLVLAYDRSVVSLSTVSANTSVVSGHTVSHADATGTVTIEIRQLDNLTNTGTVPLIDLTFDAVAGGSTSLDLQSVDILEDGAASSSPGSMVDGSITVDSAPVLVSIGDKSVSEGSPLSFTISATDADGDAITYSATDLPTGATLGSSSGVFSWTPGYSDSGDHVVTFIATANGATDSETITIRVGENDRSPVLAPIGDKSVSEGSSLSFTISATDDDGDTITYSATGLPSGAILGSSSGVFSWTPGYSDSGDHVMTFIATANGATDSETITISVGDNDRSPVLAPIGDKSVSEGSPLSFTISATDADGDTITYSATDLPSGATLGSSSGVFSWTPGYSDSGDHVVTFIASANGATDSEMITIRVGDNDRSPVLAPIGDKSVSEGSILSFTISATDADGDTISYSATDLPSGATLGSSSGVFSWTPGYTAEGRYDITFTATANGQSDSEKIRITVNDLNRAPVLSSISPIITDENEPVTITLQASDADGDTLSYSDDVNYGSLSGNVFTWTPTYSDSGVHYIEFTVSDGEGSDSKVAEITVNNVNRPPLLGSIGNKDASEGSLLEFTISATDPDGDTVIYDSEGLPAGAILDSSSGAFSWTPGYEDAGVYNVRFIAYANGYYDSEAITITVADVNRAPEMDSIPGHSVSENEPVTIILNAIDPDGDSPLYYSMDADFGTLIGNVFTWTPTYTDSGIHYISFTVSDGDLWDTEVATIGVNDENAPPEFAYVGNQSVAEGSTLRFSVTATDVDDDDLTYSVPEKPEGSSIAYNSAGMTFTWTPDSDDAGTYSVTFKVTDGVYDDYLVVPIVVYDYNHAPVFTSLQSTYTVNESEQVEIILGSQDEDNDSLTRWVNNTGDASGELTGDMYVWNTGYSDSGTYEIEFAVSDGKVTTVETTTVVVNDKNAPPVLASIGSRRVTEGSTLSFTISATDEDGDDADLTYSAQNIPDSAIFNTTTHTFSWTTKSGDAGSYVVLFSVSDGTAIDSENVSITVTTVSSGSGGGGGSSASSSSSSGGGGGSAVSNEDPSNIVLKDYALKLSVLKDIDAVFPLEEPYNSINSVKFTPGVNGGQAKLVVEMLKDTSSQVSLAAPGNVYRNMNIYISTTLVPSAMHDINVAFKVEKSWVNVNSVNISDIVLYRYSDGSWKQLPTEMSGDDADYIYFQSKTPGFSPFAISTIVPEVENKISQANTVTLSHDASESILRSVDDDSMQIGLIPAEDADIGVSILLFVAVLILAGVGVIYWALRDES